MGIEKLYSLYGNTISKRTHWIGKRTHWLEKRTHWIGMRCDWFIVGISFYLGEVI